MNTTFKFANFLLVLAFIDYGSAYGQISPRNTKINKYSGNNFDGAANQSKLLPGDIHNNHVYSGIDGREYPPSPVTEEETFEDNPYEKNLNIINNIDFDPMLSKLYKNYDYSCLLDDVKLALLWWSFPNGTLRTHWKFPPITNFLDLSYRQISSDDSLYRLIRLMEINDTVVFSAAHNNLTHVPQRTLESLADSLKYLTLSGNSFDVNTGVMLDGETGVSWATFPHLPILAELDISNCMIEHVTRDTFRNISNLKNLYMSHNKILVLLSDAFYFVPSLRYLDLSFTNVFDYSSKPTLDAIINLFYGMKIQQTTFKYLPNIVYLDLSHTKITRNSLPAFTHLPKLKYLSLCYTAFPMIGKLFKNSALVGLDLSGNSVAAFGILDDAFEGVSETLSILYFEMSNLKNISWVKRLNNLRILGIAGNNINSITYDTFRPLSNLQVLDLNANHVGNWYNRVFTSNKNLSVLSLKDNNINIITSEMLKDFSLLDYLSLGDNNFVCDCLLRDLVDAAVYNNQNSDCASHMTQNNALESIISNFTETSDIFMDKINISSIIGSHVLRRLQVKIEPNNSKNRRNKLRFVLNHHKKTFRSPKSCASSETQTTNYIVVSKHNESSLLKFELLDYEDEHYWCFNETEKLSVVELNCRQRSFMGDNITQQLNRLTYYVVVSVSTLLGVSLIGLVVYIKRWHIYYYYSSIKSSALMSEAVKENVDKCNSLYENGGSNTVYDIFISYCQNDRDWVLNELIPNVEENGEISICLHERDFQIGVTILDNIISCMDRSRALMLIVSSNFLLSHWCQFEMHLAQRRMFETCKDHLILVFLEDIPRSKRPKNLQYLMEVKTYIKWPGGKSIGNPRSDDYKIFWKRLKRSLQRLSAE